MNQTIEELGEEIIELEKEIRLGNSVQSNQEKIEVIIHDLSFSDMLKLDDYIQSRIDKNKKL